MKGYVQLDEQNDPICSSAGCNQYKHKLKPRGYEIDYPVPDFGDDQDVVDNNRSLHVAEAMKGRKWHFKEGKKPSEPWEIPAKRTMYNFAPELDGDMKGTISHLTTAEGTYGAWDI